LNRKDLKEREENIFGSFSCRVIGWCGAWGRIAKYPMPILCKRVQLLTRLKLNGRSISFLINWKIPRLKNGIQRVIWRER
jgi:hypothetical protein